MATFAGRYDEPMLRRVNGRLGVATGITVRVYESNGTTVATLYTDRTKATTADNPVAVDASGNLEFFADPGTYVLSILESDAQVATNVVSVHADPAEPVDATNLTWTAATSTVASDTGTDAVLTVVDGSNPGLMSVAQFTKLAGIETAATADQTAAELLTAIKTVDGSGSGLDADLLDGLNSTAFALASDLGAYLPKAGGTMTGAITLAADGSSALHPVTKQQLDNATSAAVPKALVDAKGDLLAASAADTVGRLAVGTDGDVLTADATQALGVKWATPAAPAGDGDPALNWGWPTGSYVQPIHSATAAVITATGRVYATPVYVRSSGTIDRLAVNITTAAADTCRVVVLSDRTDVAGFPHFPNQVVAIGSVDTSTTGKKEATVSATVPQGWVWVAFLADAPARFSGISGSPLGVGGDFATGVCFGSLSNVSAGIASVGDTWPTSWNVVTNPPLIGMRKA